MHASIDLEVRGMTGNNDRNHSTGVVEVDCSISLMVAIEGILLLATFSIQGGREGQIIYWFTSQLYAL